MLQAINDISSNRNNWIVSNIKKEGHEITRVELKPLDISYYCGGIFSKCDKTLMMSATILDKDAFCTSTGLAPETVRFIRVGSDFPICNRPIYPLNIAPLNYSQLQQDNVQKSIARVIDTIMTRHSLEKGLIHTTSYKQLNFIRENRCRLLETDPEIDRVEVITEHINTTKPTVLISPSLQLGLDLKEHLFKKCDMRDCCRTATKKIRLYLPIEEEHLGPVTRTRIRNEGFEIRQKSYALKRSMKLSVCKVCYDTVNIDGFDDIINMNIDGKLQSITRIRKL